MNEKFAHSYFFSKINWDKERMEKKEEVEAPN